MNSLNEILESVREEFSSRKFSAGLLIAMIDFVDHLCPAGQIWESSEEFFLRHPRQNTTTAGRHANTLIVQDGKDSTISLRPFYNATEKYFRVEHKRFDYPSCAPHATQAWSDYHHWLSDLLSATRQDRATLRQEVVDFVLSSLPSHEFDPTSISIEPRLFEEVLTCFDFSNKKGEKTGAAFQGLVFGYLRADNPHLQVEIERVRTGSKRLQRVGDIDCWDGKRLALTAEVKHYEMDRKAAEDLLVFIEEGMRRKAIVAVVASSFTSSAKEFLSQAGANCLDIDWMLQAARLWDPAKQRIAISSFVYYVEHVEKNHALSKRLGLFLKTTIDQSSA